MVQLSIKLKLIIILSITAIGFIALVLLSNISISQLNTLTNIQKSVSNLNLQMLLISDTIKSFKLTKNIDEKATFDILYSQQQNDIATLKETLKSINIANQELKEFDQYFTLLNTNFNQYYDLQVVIGLDEKRGLYGALRESVHEVQSIAKKINNYELLALTYELRKHEKDFMLRRSLVYKEKFDKSIDTLIQKVATDLIKTAENKQNVLNNFQLYKERFDKLVKNEILLGLTPKDGLKLEIDTTLAETQNTLNLLYSKLEQYIIDDTDKTKFNNILLSLILVMIALIISYYYLRGINRSLADFKNGLFGFMEYLKDESIGVRRLNDTQSDEFGAMAKEVNSHINQIQKGIEQDNIVLAEIHEVVQKVGYGFFGFTIKNVANDENIEKLKITINQMLIDSKRKLDVINNALNNYAQSKFNYHISEADYVGMYGDFGTIATTTRLIRNNSSELLAMILNSGDQLDNDTTILSSASEHLSKSSNQQALSLEQTSAAIAEINSQIKQNSQSVSKMSQFAKVLTEAVNKGHEDATNTTNAMKQIQNEITSISEAISIIDQIAFQTNILSLNAAVEAATAGEAGKGFAVVAGEVRNLANRSAEAARDIKNIVDSATMQASKGKTISQQMINGYTVLHENIQNTVGVINDVVVASTEQERAIVEISSEINKLDQSTQKNAQEAEIIRELSRKVSTLSQSLVTAANYASFDQDIRKRVCNVNNVFLNSKLKNQHINLKKESFKRLDERVTFKITDSNNCELGSWIKERESEGNPIIHSAPFEQLKKSHEHVHTKIQAFLDLSVYDNRVTELGLIAQEIEFDTRDVFTQLNNINEILCKE